MITKQQRKALVFIEAEMERTGGVAPSVREVPITCTTAVRPWRAGCSSALKSVASFAAYRRRIGIEVVKPVSRFAAFRFDVRTKSLRRSDL